MNNLGVILFSDWFAVIRHSPKKKMLLEPVTDCGMCMSMDMFVLCSFKIKLIVYMIFWVHISRRVKLNPNVLCIIWHVLAFPFLQYNCNMFIIHIFFLTFVKQSVKFN